MCVEQVQHSDKTLAATYVETYETFFSKRLKHTTENILKNMQHVQHFNLLFQYPCVTIATYL
jgi:hypothetical protein